MLADRYLRERAIVPKRIFTVSTRDDAGWNELRALRATLTSQAQEHMDRLQRNARLTAEADRLAQKSVSPEPARSRPTFFFFRK
jgi:hypothetical protein